MFEMGNITQTMRFKTEVLQARLMIALSDAIITNNMHTSLEFSKNVNAAIDIEKGGLVLVPYTHMMTFVVKDSIKAQSMHRDAQASIYCPWANCTVDDVHVECFLKAPTMPRPTEVGTEWDKCAFPIPFWLAMRQVSVNTSTINLNRAVIKHGGCTIPVLKNCVPLKAGDTLMLASNKRERDVSIGDAIAQTVNDDVPAAPSTAPVDRSKGRGRGGRARGRK